jgi:hypothetical protein
MREPTEKEAIQWFDSLEEEKQDDIIEGYPDFAQLDDDQSAEWFNHISTDTNRFGAWLVSNYPVEIIGYIAEYNEDQAIQHQIDVARGK